MLIAAERAWLRVPLAWLVRLHTIVHKMLGQAVKDGLLLRNPADAATPPTAREAKAPEMQPWDAGQLAAFLGRAEGASHSHALWHLLAMTGIRRGEALALRRRDVDLNAGHCEHPPVGGHGA